jgi:hypothetical protein
VPQRTPGQFRKLDAVAVLTGPLLPAPPASAPSTFCVHGAGGISFDPDSAIDCDHLEQAKRTKEPGWTEAEPQLLLLPGPVRDAVLSWALPGR